MPPLPLTLSLLLSVCAFCKTRYARLSTHFIHVSLPFIFAHADHLFLTATPLTFSTPRIIIMAQSTAFLDLVWSCSTPSRFFLSPALPRKFLHHCMSPSMLSPSHALPAPPVAPLHRARAQLLATRVHHHLLRSPFPFFDFIQPPLTGVLLPCLQSELVRAPSCRPSTTWIFAHHNRLFVTHFGSLHRTRFHLCESHLL